MKRSEVRAFIESGVTAVDPNMFFGSGRISEFNSECFNNNYDGAWLETLEIDIELVDSRPFNGWQIRLHLAGIDKIDSSSDQYEAIIDRCDYTAQKLIKQYNDILEQSKLSTITNLSRPTFIKKHAACLTGVILSFTLNDMDQTNLC